MVVQMALSTHSEHAKVSNDARRNENITNNALNTFIKCHYGFLPSSFLVAQTTDQLEKMNE